MVTHSLRLPPDCYVQQCVDEIAAQPGWSGSILRATTAVWSWATTIRRVIPSRLCLDLRPAQRAEAANAARRECGEPSRAEARRRRLRAFVCQHKRMPV